MGEGQPSRPANILEIVAINQGRSPLTMDEPSAPALAPEDFRERIAEGHAVVDTRDPAAFGAGHIPGAYNIKGASPEFEQRVGWVVDLEVPILLVLDHDDALAAMLRKLAFVGLDRRVRGYLAGGMDAWGAAIGAQETLKQISVTELQERLAAGDGVRVLDVREPDEYEQGHVEGAASMSFKVLEERFSELPLTPDDQIALVCAGGVRSSTASSILLRRGFRNLLNVTGGMGAWRAAGLPTTRD
jgi:hydroxyacylglutathione hydrolase